LGERVFSTYGFLDAFNPTFRGDLPLVHGKMEPGEGWFDTDYLGIAQGPILAMAENYRTGLVWRVMRTNPHVLRGLRRAGFSGGWLDGLERPAPQGARSTSLPVLTPLEDVVGRASHQVP
jgi:hypothetical protein